MRLFAWSDLHVDFPANHELLVGLSNADFRYDALLVAGDVSSDPEKLMHTLRLLRRRFREVAFVPGNHDLWVPSGSTLSSLDKLHDLHAACLGEGIRVEPFEVDAGGRPVRVVPLRSWYLKPEEGDGSLFLEKPGEDPTLRAWMDNYRIKWKHLPTGVSAAEHILSLNHLPPPATAVFPAPASPVTITFSHFLPRVELVFSDWAAFQEDGRTSGHDRAPEFNFTRVAGCRQLDELLRRLGSSIHVYGHQHRNRDRVIDGVRYVSHCLGYPNEWGGAAASQSHVRPLEIAPAG